MTYGSPTSSLFPPKGLNVGLLGCLVKKRIDRLSSELKAMSSVSLCDTSQSLGFWKELSLIRGIYYNRPLFIVLLASVKKKFDSFYWISLSLSFLLTAAHKSPLTINRTRNKRIFHHKNFKPFPSCLIHSFFHLFWFNWLESHYCWISE